MMVATLGAGWPAGSAGAPVSLSERSAARPAKTSAHGAVAVIEAIIAGLPDPVIVLDRDGRAVAFNAGAGRARSGAAARRSGVDRASHAGTGRGRP